MLVSGEEDLTRRVISADAVDDGNGAPISAHPQVLSPDGKAVAGGMWVHVGYLDLEEEEEEEVEVQW